MTITGSPCSQARAQPRAAAHLEHDQRQQALLLVDPRAGQRQPLHHQAAAVRPRATAPRSSAGGRTARARSGARRPARCTTTSTIVGVSRSTHATVGRHSSSSLPVNARQAASRAGCAAGSQRRDVAREQRLDVRRAVLRRRHRAHDRARVARVVVAVERDRVPVAEVAGEEADLLAGRRLQRAACRRRRRARRGTPGTPWCADRSRTIPAARARR